MSFVLMAAADRDATWDESKCEQRTFWVALEGRVSQQEGFSVAQPRCWWVPKTGCTLTIGYHLFDTKQEAIDAARKELRKKDEEIRTQLNNLANLEEAR